MNGLSNDAHEVGSMRSGMRVFGAKFFKWKQDCDDTQLAVAMAEIERTMGQILGTANSTVAKGQSSLSFAMEVLKGDFPTDSEQMNFIVVVSDGDESCGGNPCSIVEEMVEMNEGISVSTLGVEADQAGKGNLQCMADKGNGLYFDSKDVDEFVLFLKDANAIIQENRKNKPVAQAEADSSLIASRDISQDMTEYNIQSDLPLYRIRDERFPADDTVRPSDKLYIISNRGLWLEVFAPAKNLQGWILPKTGGSEYSVTVTDDDTPLYKNKSISGQVMDYMPAGQQLTVLSKEGDWYEVFNQDKNLRGWVIAFNVASN